MEPKKKVEVLTPAQFKKLTKTEKKVAVAKDVLAQIKARKYIANSGKYISYVSTDSSYRLAEYMVGDIQSQLAEVKDCEVCAVGSCILSITKYENKLQWSDVGRVSRDCSENVDTILKKVFTAKELALIEVMFEGVYDTCSDNYARDRMNAKIDDATATKAIKWHSRFKNEENRLKAIMDNIIKNNGEIII